MCCICFFLDVTSGLFRRGLGFVWGKFRISSDLIFFWVYIRLLSNFLGKIGRVLLGVNWLTWGVFILCFLGFT